MEHTYMSEQLVSKIQALVLSKQLEKQINALVNKKFDNIDKFGNIIDEDEARKIEAQITVKQGRLANFKYIAAAP